MKNEFSHIVQVIWENNSAIETVWPSICNLSYLFLRKRWSHFECLIRIFTSVSGKQVGCNWFDTEQNSENIHNTKIFALSMATTRFEVFRINRILDEYVSQALEVKLGKEHLLNIEYDNQNREKTQSVSTTIEPKTYFFFATINSNQSICYHDSNLGSA